MRAPCGGEARVLRDVVGDHRRSHFVHFEATVGFGDLNPRQAQVAGLLHQIARDGKILVLHLLDVRQNFVDGEFFRGLPDQLLLLRKVFGREDFIRTALFQQKAAARNSGLGNRSSSGHVLNPSQ